MTLQQSREKKRKTTQRAEKTWSMEEKSPTMPSVFNRSLNIIGRHATCREVIYDVTLKNDQSSLCPHCGAASYVHGYRRRLVDFMNDVGVRSGAQVSAQGETVQMPTPRARGVRRYVTRWSDKGFPHTLRLTPYIVFLACFWLAGVSSRLASLALLLIVWNDAATEQREEEKNNAGGRKNIEHGGEISYHAQCVQSVPEYYRSARNMSRSYL